MDANGLINGDLTNLQSMSQVTLQSILGYSWIF